MPRHASEFRFYSLFLGFWLLSSVESKVGCVTNTSVCIHNSASTHVLCRLLLLPGRFAKMLRAIRDVGFVSSGAR